MAEDENEQQERGFKVEDRRRFTPDGTPREDIEAGDEPASDAAASAAAEPASDPAGSAGAEPRPDAGDQSRATAGKPADRSPSPGAGAERPSMPGEARAGAGATPEELTFSSFVVGIASQAFAFLGAVPDPQTGVVRKDLGQAKAMIDILALLAEKTAGNLDEQEARLMEEMLYELRMQYVRELRGQMPGGGKTE